MMERDYEQFNDGQDSNVLSMKLTPEETEIALNFLKRRFPNYSIAKIVSTLDHHVHKNQPTAFRRPPYSHPTQNEEQIIHFGPAQRIPLIEGTARESQRMKTQRAQSIKIIAKLFCQGGYDLKKLQSYIPSISSASYRSHLLSIMNSVLKYILNTVRQPQGKEMTFNQKYQVKNQMLYCHEWMALKDMNVFSSFLKLVQRQTINQKIFFDSKSIEGIYYLLVKRIRFQFIDTTNAEHLQSIFGEQIQKMPSQLRKSQRSSSLDQKNPDLANMISISQKVDQQKIIGQAYLKYKSISLAKNSITNILNLQGKNSNIFIKETLIRIIDKCLGEIIDKGIQQRSYGQFELIGTISSRTAQKIYDYGCEELRLGLIKLYLNKKHIDLDMFSNIVGLLNVYFSEHEIYQENSEGRFEEIIMHADNFKQEELQFDAQDKADGQENQRDIDYELIGERLRNPLRERSEGRDNEEKLQTETNFVEESIQYLIK